jgi:hypothetical protein
LENENGDFYRPLLIGKRISFHVVMPSRALFISSWSKDHFSAVTFILILLDMGLPFA